MRHTDRGSGQTLAMVKALPASGSTVVVHAQALREYVEKMIRDVRGADALRVTTVVVCNREDSARAYLSGRQGPIILDRAFYGNVSPDVERLVRQMVIDSNFVAESAERVKRP